MKKIYADRPLTDDEIAALIVFQGRICTEG